MRGFARRLRRSRYAWLDDQLQPLGAELLTLPATRVACWPPPFQRGGRTWIRPRTRTIRRPRGKYGGCASINSLPLTLIGDSLPGRPFRARSPRPGRADHDRCSAPARLRRGAACRVGRTVGRLRSGAAQAEEGTGSRCIRALAAVSLQKCRQARRDVTAGPRSSHADAVAPQDLGGSVP